jgi:hypothetical protein
MALIVNVAKLVVILGVRLSAPGFLGTRGRLKRLWVMHTAFVEGRKWNERPNIRRFCAGAIGR